MFEVKELTQVINTVAS